MFCLHVFEIIRFPCSRHAVPHIVEVCYCIIFLYFSDVKTLVETTPSSSYSAAATQHQQRSGKVCGLS